MRNGEELRMRVAPMSVGQQRMDPDQSIRVLTLLRVHETPGVFHQALLVLGISERAGLSTARVDMNDHPRLVTAIWHPRPLLMIVPGLRWRLGSGESVGALSHR